MELHGIVQNGVIVLADGVCLPEGTTVTIACDRVSTSPLPASQKKRVQLPLVTTGEPGSINLTNERIAEIFEEEDIAYARRERLDCDDF